MKQYLGFVETLYSTRSLKIYKLDKDQKFYENDKGNGFNVVKVG